MAEQEDAESSKDIGSIYIEKVRRLVAEVLDLPLEAKTLFYEQLLISDPRGKNQEAVATKAGLPKSCHVDVLYNDFALSATWNPASVLKLLEGFYLAESIVMVGGGEFDFELENVASRDDYAMVQVIPVIKAEDVRIPIAQLPEVLAKNPSVPKDILVNAEKIVEPSERHFRFHMADKLRHVTTQLCFESLKVTRKGGLKRNTRLWLESLMSPLLSHHVKSVRAGEQTDPRDYDPWIGRLDEYRETVDSWIKLVERIRTFSKLHKSNNWKQMVKMDKELLKLSEGLDERWIDKAISLISSRMDEQSEARKSKDSAKLRKLRIGLGALGITCDLATCILDPPIVRTDNKAYDTETAIDYYRKAGGSYKAQKRTLPTRLNNLPR